MKKIFFLFLLISSFLSNTPVCCNQTTVMFDKTLERIGSLSDDQLETLVKQSDNPRALLETILKEQQQAQTGEIGSVLETAALVGGVLLTLLCYLVTFVGGGCYLLKRFQGAHENSNVQVVYRDDSLPTHRKVPDIFG